MRLPSEEKEEGLGETDMNTTPDHIERLVVEARQRERAICIGLVEAPVEGLLALASRIDQSGGDSGHTRATADALKEAAKVIRESGEFRDAAQARMSGKEKP